MDQKKRSRPSDWLVVDSVIELAFLSKEVDLLLSGVTLFCFSSASGFSSGMSAVAMSGLA